MEQEKSDNTSFITSPQQTIGEDGGERRQQGVVPTDHPHPGALVAKFMASRERNQRLQAEYDGKFTLTTTEPPTYHPSVRPIDDLVPIMVSEMELGKHHSGRKVTVAILTPPDVMNAIIAVAEDEEGTAMLLKLYHQPKLPGVRPDDVLSHNMVYIIKEPFFEAMADGTYSMRVDHVSDIVWMQVTDPRIPTKWKVSRPETVTSEQIRRQGNDAVKNEQWFKAGKLYSEAIRIAETPEERHSALLNRSLVNLRLDRPEEALNDASAVVKDGKINEKSLYREARALYELRDFPQSLMKWQQLTKLYPQSLDARAEIMRTKERVREAETGDYNWASMYKQVEATPPFVDCANYVGPVAVRAIEGLGNGLFTTAPVKAGTLLICEKAFAYSFTSALDRSLSTQAEKELCETSFTNFTTKIVQKLYHSPRASQAFNDLHHGDYRPVDITQVDGKPVVDTFFVENVVKLNSFWCPRSSYTLLRRNLRGPNKGNFEGYGAWLLGSRINHSCIGNCYVAFIGDMQVIRTVQDLDAGTEVRSQYLNSHVNDSYQETQEKFSHWGFTCECAWCLDRKSIPENIAMKRHALSNNLAETFERLFGDTRRRLDDATLQEICQLLSQLEDTYPAGAGAGALRMQIWQGYFNLGSILIEKGRLAAGIEATVKGLEALGFEIVASPPRGNSRRLEIRRWGHFVMKTFGAFMQMCKAYMEIAPELYPVARDYGKMTYSMSMGTDTTIAWIFPNVTWE